MLTRLLYRLDRSSTRFPEQLSELLQDVGWVKEFQYLPEGDLVKLIGYLDNVRSISTSVRPCSSSLQVLNSLDRTGSPFREGLHLLREICSLRTILPTTCEVFGDTSFHRWILDTPSKFGSTYKGYLGTAAVCIKRFDPNPAKDRVRAEQVSHLRNLWLDRHALIGFWRHCMGKLWCGNTSITRMLCLSRVSPSNQSNSFRNGCLADL